VLDESSSTGASSALRSVDAVQQLADGDDADRPFLVADEGFQPRSAGGAFPVDQEIGID